MKKLRLFQTESHICHAPQLEAPLGVQCLFIFWTFFCVCAWSLLTGSQRHPSPFPRIFLLPSLPSFLKSCILYLVPRALYLLNLPQKEKKHLPNISKTSGCISLVGDCVGANCPSFIYQTGSVYVQAEHNVKHKTLGLKDEVRQHQSHVFQTPRLQPSFLFFFYLKHVFLVKRNKQRCGLERDVAAVLICQFYQSVEESALGKKSERKPQRRKTRQVKPF